MRQILILSIILTISCSTKKSEPSDKTFTDLTQEEKTELFGGFGDEFKGDVRTYSGVAKVVDANGQQTFDSLTFIELVMDSDKRFAIRTRYVESEVKTDSMTFFMQGGNYNKGLGKWTDLGDKFELKFQIGTVDSFFDKEDNETNINILDNYTFHLDKNADKIWIWKTLCKK